MKSLRNGVLVDMTAEEVTAREAEMATLSAKKQTRADVATQEATDKANGNQKLVDLGLTQDEVDAL
jgi:hypothetical protein